METNRKERSGTATQRWDLLQMKMPKENKQNLVATIAALAGTTQLITIFFIFLLFADGRKPAASHEKIAREIACTKRTKESHPTMKNTFFS